MSIGKLAINIYIYVYIYLFHGGAEGGELALGEFT